MRSWWHATLSAAWRAARWHVVVPALQLAVYVCAAMSLMLFLERMYMAIVVSGLWLRQRRPKRPGRRGAVVALAVDDDMEAAADRFPMVLVQIPMFNEKQVRMIPPIRRPSYLLFPTTPPARSRQRRLLLLGYTSFTAVF
jgi:hypothetical protein